MAVRLTTSTSVANIVGAEHDLWSVPIDFENHAAWRLGAPACLSALG